MWTAINLVVEPGIHCRPVTRDDARFPSLLYTFAEEGPPMADNADEGAVALPVCGMRWNLQRLGGCLFASCLFLVGARKGAWGDAKLFSQTEKKKEEKFGLLTFRSEGGDIRIIVHFSVRTPDQELDAVACLDAGDCAPKLERLHGLIVLRATCAEDVAAAENEDVVVLSLAGALLFDLSG